MPRVSRTILPRIKKSLQDRGLLVSLGRSFLLPMHLLRDFRAARSIGSEDNPSEYDLAHGVDTEGQFDGWTYLSDLDISSPNWIDGRDYSAIEPDRFASVLNSLEIDFTDYTFIDFGSGKGRALLLASEFPFKKIIGLEFSEELHRVAEENIRRYRSATQRCSNIQPIAIDFTAFVLPPEPLVLFFFDPCLIRVFAQVLTRIRESLTETPRPLYLCYVAPGPQHDQLFASAGFTSPTIRSAERNFVVYSTHPSH
jgi:SAM-dependent methyltransferase